MCKESAIICRNAKNRKTRNLLKKARKLRIRHKDKEPTFYRNKIDWNDINKIQTFYTLRFMFLLL
jgi:hypothetical protein